jgi:hypothetical protein
LYHGPGVLATAGPREMPAPIMAAQVENLRHQSLRYKGASYAPSTRLNVGAGCLKSFSVAQAFQPVRTACWVRRPALRGQL